MELKVILEASPELIAALNQLAALGDVEKNAAPVAQPTPTLPEPNPVAPVAPVPTAATPVYTLEQIAHAGAALIDAGKMEQLLALLGKYQVAAITQIKPEQYGAFATELRALGAQI